MNPLNPYEIVLVQNSFRKVSQQSERAAGLFFERLFEFHPFLKTVVEADATVRHRQFFRVLGTIVYRLDYFELVGEYVGEWAFANPHLSEREELHHSFGAALFWMLEQILADDFSANVYGAWITIFQTLSKEIQAASPPLLIAS